MSLSTIDLLSTNDIRSAIVVDDAYDRTPTAADLAFDSDEWAIFLDDLTEKDLAMLRAVYPAYDPAKEGELFRSDDFIKCLWENRERFRPDLIGPLFDTYEQDSTHDLRVLDAVETQLSALDLRVRNVGRDFVADAAPADLIIIDLFLGAQQNESDMHVSTKGIAQIVQSRLENPPAVILMSRSRHLPGHAETFRDDAKVFASGFRTITKSNIEKPDRLEHLIRELARHRQDSLKLNAFLRRWNDGLSGALERTLNDMRRLDLEDWAQIHDLLLNAEESTAARYVLEILELAFLHELESDDDILSAAAALDTLDRDTYPPTTITGSKDTLGLVAKTLYEHKNCSQLDADSAAPVAFGDIIGIIQGSEFPKDSVFSPLGDAVLITMTPGCDLQRDDAARILFMVGDTKDLDAPGVRDAAMGLRTPILSLPDERRVWVDWQPSHLLTLTSEEVRSILSDDQNSATILGRLRTANAVSLQQQLLSDLGRVGLVAPIPSTFPIQVAVYYPSAEEQLVPLMIDDNETIDAVCYVGRRSNHQYATAPFDTIHRFAFLDALQNLGPDQIDRHSTKAVSQARHVEVLDLLFSRGLRFDPGKNDPQNCTALVDGQEFSLGKVVYRRSVSQAFTNKRQINNAGLVFEIRGLPLDAGE